MAREGRSHNSLFTVGLAISSVGMVGLCLSFLWIALHRSRVESHEQRPNVEIVRPYQPYRVETAPTVGEGVSADDGELHDARTIEVSYGFEDGSWLHSDTERIKAYGKKKVQTTFVVRYPVLTGELEHLDEVNELLRSCAMESVHVYYEDPSKETIERVKFVAEDEEQIVLSSEVSYAVSYNTEDFLSVCFSDVYYIGSEYAGFTQLRTVNVNLKTGKTYVLDDILTVNDEIAGSFVDNLVQASGDDTDGNGVITNDECLSVQLAGRRALMDALKGEGDLAPRVETCFFVDGNGKVNLGATYWVSGDNGFVRGWWDVTVTGAQARKARKDSDFWDLME